MTEPDARAMLTNIAAECHRAKWQFDLSEDYKPSRAAARAAINSAFNELHRIGDLAIKGRDALGAQPQYFSRCLRAGACHGKCESTACTNYGRDIVVRKCVEPKQDGIVYPSTEKT